jgi:site-specific DNA recombinase
VEDGKSGGGLCYGYRIIKKLDERGDPIRGIARLTQPRPT